jgi:hypothetical protein
MNRHLSDSSVVGSERKWRLDMSNLTDTLDAVDRLLKMFVVERYVYLVLTIASFLILLIFGYQVATTKQANTEVVVAVFGGSGLVAASSARISWFFNRAFSLIERLIQGAADDNQRN